MSEQRGKIQIIQLDLAKELSHGICVSNLVSLVAKELQFSEEHCYRIALAGFLHDIGKLELQKYLHEPENTLTIEEMKYVRMHATLGAKYLFCQGYPQDIVEWIYCHHENCDGSGYPRNLTKDEIPIEARIIRVCDVFAALTSDRPYRKAFDRDGAVELMIDEIKNYDLKVFLAFQRVIHDNNLENILDSGALQKTLEDLLGQDNYFPAENIAENAELIGGKSNG